jgi:two-component system phosphate regulon sensor histidine kinase PhoR
MSNLFKEIVDFSPYGVAIFDKRLGELTYVNKTFKDWGLLDTHFLEVLKCLSTQEVEFKGKFFKVHCLEKENERVYIFEDITPLKTYQRAKKDFVANVSHELKTPISVISSIAETLFEEEQDPFKRKFLERILKRTKEMEALVEDLLILAALESKEGKVIWEKVNLHEVANEVVSNLQEFAEKKDITVKVNIPENFTCTCDGHKITILLKNLVENAIKYNKQGGKVEINAKRTDKGVILEVSDTGIGIPKKHLSLIFERFYRVDKSRSREIRGTGLGLSIVKHIALIHGGKVEVESEEGKGSTFRVFIPQP